MILLGKCCQFSPAHDIKACEILFHKHPLNILKMLEGRRHAISDYVAFEEYQTFMDHKNTFLQNTHSPYYILRFLEHLRIITHLVQTHFLSNVSSIGSSVMLITNLTIFPMKL